MHDEEKLECYVRKGFSNSLILISVGAQKSPETILDYAKELKKILN